LARDNYSYKKFQRELAQKKKKEEKRQARLDKKNVQPVAQPAPAPSEEAAAAPLA
jgi:hypothetical protein